MQLVPDVFKQFLSPEVSPLYYGDNRGITIRSEMDVPKSNFHSYKWHDLNVVLLSTHNR